MNGWSNGDKGKKVRTVASENFKTLSRHLNHNMLALSRAERLALTTPYLSTGLRVYDTTLETWYEYTGNGWIEWYPKGKTFSFNFAKGGWLNNKIDIPYYSHLITNPIVQMFMHKDGAYVPVIGGVTIDTDFNVTLFSDYAFEGKVVIR